MHPGRQLSGLAQRREELRARIRDRRAACAAAAGRAVLPLRWIDLGLRVRRLVRTEAEWWMRATMQ